MNSTNKENIQSESKGPDELPIVGISRPTVLKAVRKDGKPHPYYQKFIPAYGRFVDMLEEEGGYTRLSEIEENLARRLRDLGEHVGHLHRKVRSYSSLNNAIESAENISQLFEDSVFEDSIWEIKEEDNINVESEEKKLLLELREGWAPEKEDEVVVHVGESSWRAPAEIERLRSKLRLLIRSNSIQARKLDGRRDRARAALNAVQEVLFEYETGQETGALLEQSEFVDRGDDEKKPGPDERISDEEIEAQIKKLDERGIVDSESVAKTPLGRKLAEEFEHLCKRQYINRLDQMNWGDE